jgi:hypothetical protein
MVRPRASERNLAFAFSLADALLKKGRAQGKFVPCRGKNSVFELLAACVPDLVRRSDECRITNRNGITETELNKYLAKCGYRKSRNRKRIKGTRDKWDAGCPKWHDREWMNPDDKDDVHELKTRLNACCNFAPNLKMNIVSESIIAYLNTIWINEAADVKPDEWCLEADIQGPELVPRMCVSVHNRLILGETPSRRWPTGLDGVPICFGPVFHAFYQAISQPKAPKTFLASYQSMTPFIRIIFSAQILHAPPLAPC